MENPLREEKGGCAERVHACLLYLPRVGACHYPLAL